MANSDRARAQFDAIEDAKPRIFGAVAKSDAIRALWRSGMPPGDRTGWGSVDKHYTVAPGQFTVMTGWPGSGKSEWLDALLINLARQGWKTVYFSPENMPAEMHIAKLMEKISGLPFGAGPSERISEEMLDELMDEITQAFQFIEFDSGAMAPMDVIDLAQTWLNKQPADCKRGVVIDPWNELEHWRPSGQSETEYISNTLIRVRAWARKTKAHVWIVAHPQKMRRDDQGKLPVPKPDMISGSAHWWNKSDCAITIHRNLHDPHDKAVEVHVQKIRFKNIGHPGMIVLDYDRITGRYHEQRPRPITVPRHEPARAFNERAD